MSLEHCLDATPMNPKVAVHVKVQNSAKFLKKMKNVRIFVYPLLQVPSSPVSNNCQLTKLANRKSRPKDIQINSVIQQHPNETTH